MAALFPLDFYPRRHLQRYCKYRCGVEFNFCELRIHSESHHDLLHFVGPEDRGSESKLFRGTLGGLLSNLRFVGWQPQDQQRIARHLASKSVT